MDPFAQVSSAAHSGAYGINNISEPSLANLRAGNYKKGRCEIHGLRVAIETPQGQRRSGKEDGKPWSVICQAHYGYIEKTRGADGDELDVYVGPWPESGMAYVVNQAKPDGSGFDEHKILMAFPDSDSAMIAYRNSYEKPGPTEMGIVPCTIDQLKWWLKFGNHAIPLTSDQLPYDGTATMNDVTWDSAANPVGLTLPQLLYAMRRDDAGDHLLLDAVTQADVLEASDGEAVLDALVVPLNRLERKMGQMQVIMRAASKAVRPGVLQITPPFKQRGTTNVAAIFEMDDGQTVTAYFHNPDATPNKLTSGDEMVSWKWMLNKKDVTIVVAPERGQELNPREVARRIMRLVEANSARFQAANTRRTERMAGIEASKASVAAKQAELDALGAEIATLEDQVEAKRAAPPAVLQQRSGGPEEQAAADAALAMAAQVVADLGGTFTAEGNSGMGTAGAWSYGSAVVNGIPIQLAASGGGVVQVNRKPHDPDGVVNTAPDQVRRSILAVAPPPVAGSSEAKRVGEIVKMPSGESFTAPPATFTGIKVVKSAADGSPTMIESEDGRFVWGSLTDSYVKDAVVGRDIYQMRYVGYAIGDSAPVPDSVAGAAREFLAAVFKAQSDAKKERPNAGPNLIKNQKYANLSDAEIKRLEAEYDDLQNEGGEGFNPYRDRLWIEASSSESDSLNANLPNVSIESAVVSALKAAGWTEDDGGAVAKKTFKTVNVQQDARAFLTAGDEYNRILRFEFTSEGRNVAAGNEALIPINATEEDASRIAAAAIVNAEKSINESYGVSRAATPTPPYNPDDMDAAVAYAAETRRQFNAGDVQAAWARYQADPNGGGNPNINPTFEQWSERMKASDGPVAANPLDDARAYLATVIDGKADLADSEVADKLSAIYEAHNGDAEFDALFAKAADAYQAFMVDAAKKAMG